MYVTYTRIYGWSDYGGESSYQPGYRLENMMWMTLLVYDYIIPGEKLGIQFTNIVSGGSGSSGGNRSGNSSSGRDYSSNRGYSSGGGGSGSGYYSTSSGGGSGNSFYQPSAYERAKSSGQSSYNWFNSKLKEAGNIWNSWTKGMEKTVKHFCTTAKRIKKDAVRSVKAANIAIGISAITIGKMKLEQLKKKLSNINISIDYTGTWKDSLQLGLGIVTTGGGLLLTLAGGGSEIASVGSSSAISIPAATEGIGIAGSGLAISFDALRNMFDVRIQKSESSKGDGGGKSDETTVDDLLEGLEETTNGKGTARNFESTGGYDQTLKDFDALNPSDVKNIQTKYGPGKVGMLSDGTKVVARPGSKTGGATLEIKVSNSKIRY